MAKTYDPSQIATDETYQVRFLVGDTAAPPNVTPATAVLDDNEIDWLLATEANVYMAAAAAADAIVGVMNGAASGTTGVVTRKRVGQTDISYANGKTATEYSALAAQLRRRSGHQVAFAGGISASDKRTRATDSDLPAGRLRLNQFDSPLTGPGGGSNGGNDLLDQ
jgi:hypothetical protein